MTAILASKTTSPVDVKARHGADIRPGDTVRVWQKIKEKDKTRLQAFEGVVIVRKHGKESGATFTVRKVSSGVGVEKIFPLYSPVIDKIEIVKRARIRRAKLYYIRDKAAREIKKKMRQTRFEAQAVASEVVKEEVQGEEGGGDGNTDTAEENTPKTEEKAVEEKNVDVGAETETAKKE
jgi:large subunit ribosomal protein L19